MKRFDVDNWLEEAKARCNRLHGQYPISSIADLFDEIKSRDEEIERLEEEINTLRNRSSIDPANPKFVAMKDGNSWHFSLPDFINLQESNSIFLSQYDVDMDYIYMLVLQNNAKHRLYYTKGDK